MRAWRVALAAGAIASGLDAQSLFYEGGAAVASGEYIFTERTTSWTWYNGLAVNAGPVTFRASFPTYVQNTTLITGSSTGFVPSGGSSSGVVGDSSSARKGVRRGRSSSSFSVVDALGSGTDPVEVPTSAVTGYEATLGDPSVNMRVTAWRGVRTSVELGAGAKIPITDTTDFGTGEWDIGGSISVSQRLGSSTLLGLDVSYWHLGDLPDLDFRDPILATVSIAYLNLDGWGGMGLVSGSRSVIEGFQDTYSVGLGVSKVWARTALGMTGSLGLSETAPDFTLGINWRVGIL